jgi:hypothetical protein
MLKVGRSVLFVEDASSPFAGARVATLGLRPTPIWSMLSDSELFDLKVVMVGIDT